MNKQDIRKVYTEKVAELLNQGYTIFPDTMGGSEGDIAHIDLTNGSEIVRVLLTRDVRCETNGYYGDTIRLTVGKAAPDTWVGSRWDGTVWNKRLEPLSQTEWAWIESKRGNDWYVDLEEGARIQQVQEQRRKAREVVQREARVRVSAVLKWLRKQPHMKTCQQSDIESIAVFRNRNGKRSYEITAKGKQYTIG